MPKEHAQAIGNALKQAREARGENLAEAAFRIALSPSQLRAIEAADVTPFYSMSYYRQAVERYASFLGVSIADITAINTPAGSVDGDAIDAPSSPDVSAESLSEPPQDAPAAAPVSPSESAIESAPESASHAPETADEPVSLRERLGNSPDAAPLATKQRTTFGWIALIAAIVIALGVLKVAMEKPTPSPVATLPSPVSPPVEPVPSEPQKPAVMPSPSSPPPSPAVSAAPAPAPAPTPTQAVSAAPAPAPTKSPAIASSAPPATRGADSQLESKATTWVQIVKNNGEKLNLKLEPGQKIDFSSSDTAAIVFGQPDQASLKVKGRPVNVKPFMTQDNPSRALVILNQIRE